MFTFFNLKQLYYLNWYLLHNMIYQSIKIFFFSDIEKSEKTENSKKSKKKDKMKKKTPETKNKKEDLSDQEEDLEDDNVDINNDDQSSQSGNENETPKGLYCLVLNCLIY